MKTLEVAYSLALLMTVILLCCFAYACYRFVEVTIASIPYEATLLLGLTCCASVGAVVAGSALFFLRWMSARSRQIFAKNGLYPHVSDGIGGYVNLNEAGAQSIAALSAYSPSKKVLEKVIENSRSIGSYDPALIPGPAAPEHAPLAVSDVIEACDPKNNPHWLLVGSTGSGKTSATYQILSRLKDMYHCEFIIAEKGGVNWGLQTTATTTEQIAVLILEENEEMERRMKMLRQHDVCHVSDLPQPEPYRVFVMEEMDAVFDELKLTDRALRTKTLVALKNIARMGRKAGICLLAVSQSGTGDVFDPNVRKNLGNALLFRSEHTVANAWQIGERLNNLPVGMAYSVGHGGFVHFGKTARPQLVINGSCGPLGSSNAAEPVASVAPVAGRSGDSLQRLARGCEPDEQLAEQLRRLHDDGRGMSITSLCNEVYGYKDGTVFRVIKRALGMEGAGDGCHTC